MTSRTEAGDGGVKPPRRTAVGTGGDDEDDDNDPFNYRRGQLLRCRVIQARGNDGYDVNILMDGRRAFLRSDRPYKPGDIVSAKFSHWQDL